MSDSAPTFTRRRVLRPRWAWAGLAVLLLGLALVAAGLVEGSRAWCLAGLWLLAVGVGAAVYGGLLFDVRRNLDPRAEIEEVRRGGSRLRPGPDARQQLPHAEATAEADAAERRAALSASHSAGRPNLVPVGATLALVVCTWLLLAQWTVYPTNVPGQNNALRDLGVAILTAVCAIRIAVAGPRPWSSAAIAAGGVALVLFGALMPHDSTGISVNEVVCGLATLAAAALTLDRGGIGRHTPT